MNASPEMIAAAWDAFRAGRPGRILGPGAGFVEALNAALAVSPYTDLSAKLVAAGEENARLKAERDEARDVVALVNNSFGSWGYFLEPHPASQIEAVKEYGAVQWRRAEAAEARCAALEAQRDGLKAVAERAAADEGWREKAVAAARSRIAALEAALRPFADQASEWDEWHRSGHRWISTNVDDLRRARAVLSAPDEGGRDG